MIDSISAASIASSGITVTISPDYLLDGLTAGYVVLTLALAVIAFWSLRQTQASLNLTRQQIELNRRQSQEATAASERHSQATVDTVNRQIAASERQAKEALAVAREQIEQSKQPILIPLSPLPLSSGGELDNTNTLSLMLRNVGTGVALNIWGAVALPKAIPRRPYAFSNLAHLLQDKEDNVLFDTDLFHSFDENDKFGEYSLWPSSELTPFGTTKRLKYAARLTLTYIDVFGIKHAAIYDYTALQEWKIVKHLRVQHDLDDLHKQKKL